MHKLILIGSSTGGPGHIQKIISSLDDSFESSLVIAQHMQNSYIKSFATQLKSETSLKVYPTQDCTTVDKKAIYVLSQTSTIEQKGGSLQLIHQLQQHDTYCPDINVLFNSASKLDKSIKILCIILTGIGDDGSLGFLNLYKNGATCIAEDESSAVVYGMPKMALETNPNCKKMPLTQIIQEIKRF